MNCLAEIILVVKMRLLLAFPLFIDYALFLFCLSEAKTFDSITSQDVELALKRAREKVKQEEMLKRELIIKGNFLNPSVISAEARHQLRGGNLGRSVYNSAQSILETASADLVSRFGLNKNDIEKLSNLPLDGEIGRQIAQECNDERPTNCDPNSKYRTIDGSCNNLERPNEGRTFTCLLRLLPSDYEDGISAPRTQNGTLPNPRRVSILIHRIEPENTEIDEPYLSAWHMSFGQFLDHDLEFTTQPTTENNAPIACCNNNVTHPECLPIDLSDDPDFESNCMNFVRDARCPQCTLNKREQMNSLTSFIDGSQIYGTTDEQAASLRSNNSDGKLRARIVDGVGEMPPANPNPEIDQCSRPNFPCFFLGDFRANQNLLLLSHHIIFFRFHNQLVDQLGYINPQWDGERLYQEARRIVIACLQHITFTEYLPLVVGDEVMRSFCLDCHNTQYNSSVQAVITNVFAAAAFRFGHSTVVDYFLTLTETNERGIIEFRDTFFNPIPMYQPGLPEDILRGSIRQPQQFFDKFLVSSVTKYLYQRLNVTQGLDLASINIQRGRDHGLPGYTEYVEYVHGFQINNFSDLENRRLVSRKCINAGLFSLYQSVHDIDVWTGLLCEPYTGTALVGWTTRFLIADQFYRLKFGDRFFYTHVQQAGSFTYAQKVALSNVAFARIICNVYDLPEIGESVFEYSSPIVPCSDYNRIPPIDLSPWKE